MVAAESQALLPLHHRNGDHPNHNHPHPHDRNHHNNPNNPKPRPCRICGYDQDTVLRRIMVLDILCFVGVALYAVVTAFMAQSKNENDTHCDVFDDPSAIVGYLLLFIGTAGWLMYRLPSSCNPSPVPLFLRHITVGYGGTAALLVAHFVYRCVPEDASRSACLGFYMLTCTPVFINVGITVLQFLFFCACMVARHV